MATLSVIIPVYNAEKYVAQTLMSVLQQPCNDYEIVVVDDGSTDNSLSIIMDISKKYENVRVFHKENGGVSSARNYGIEKSNGLYISFLDADDVYCKNAYTNELRNLLLKEEYDVFKFGYILGDQTLKRGNEVSFKEQILTGDDDSFHSNFRDHVTSYFFLRKMIENNVSFPERVKYGEDIIFIFLSSYLAKNIFICEKELFVHRSNPTSTVHSLNIYIAKLEEMNAWARCRDECICHNAKIACDSAIYWYFIQFIRYACEIGVPCNKILEDIHGCMGIQSMLKNFVQFDENTDDFKFYQQFLNNPLRTRRQIFIKSMPINYLKLFRNTRLGSFLNSRFRYKIDISDKVFAK